VDTPAGKWFITVHSYENGYRTLGRQLLLLPIEWTADGWFRVPPGITADTPIPMPIPGTTQQPFLDPSDSFSTPELGLQWGFWHEFDPARFSTGAGALVLQARGKSMADTSALTTPVGAHSYTVEVDCEISPDCSSGLLLFYDPEHATGILLDAQGIGVRIANGYVPSREHQGASRATLRIVNDRQEIDFYYRLPGQNWRKTQESAEISGMNHNVLGGFLDVRPAVFAAGQGHATFRNFRYWPQVEVPL
jgi:xylan 1,4-beta-xylosidase